MKKVVIVTSVILLLSMLAWGLGCAKPAPPPTPKPSPVPTAPPPSPPPSPAPKPPPSPPPEWPKRLTLSTLWAGASITVYGTAVAALIEKSLKIPTAPTNSSATVEATMLMLQGKSQLATANAPNAGYLLKNQPPWPADSSKIFRGITFGAYESQSQWFTRADSGINTFTDLKGKRVMCAREGEPAFEDVWRAVQAVYGVSFTAMPDLGIPNQVTALKEGRADAAMCYGAAPVPGLLELQTTHPIRIISHTEAGLKAVFGKLDWVAQPFTIKAGTYKGQDKDVLALMFNLGVSARRDLPDDLVYTIAKAIDENIADLRAVHPTFKTWKIQELANSPYGPYHAGAFKYYTEKGYLTPESIAKHKELLAMIGEKS